MREVKPDIASYARIRIFGIGGGGSHVVSRIVSVGPIENVECVALNTDAQDLAQVKAHKKLHIGARATGGLGAGMSPELGRAAAEEDRERVAQTLKGSDFAVLVAGFGGGTGTGALPVVGEIARSLDILTLAIVTKPFSFEGAERRRIAEEGIAALRSHVDAFLVIPNDRLSLVLDVAEGLEQAFATLDELLRSYIVALYELISLPGFINVDFADLKSVLKNTGPTFIGIGQAGGEGALKKAVGESLHPPFLEFSVKGASQVLFELSGGRDLSLKEVREIVESISEGVHQDARILFGARHDYNLRRDVVKIVLVASGFLQVGIPFAPPAAEREAAVHASFKGAGDELRPNPVLSGERPRAEAEPAAAPPGRSQQEKREEESSIFDIPAFLRRKKKG